MLDSEFHSALHAITRDPDAWIHRRNGTAESGDDGLPPVIDWAEFWKRDRTVGDYLAEPLLPRGRAVALYARAKEGKSLLALDVAAALATGRPILGRAAAPTARVLYLDHEMAEDDLVDRLEDLSYGPDDDLSNLRYALLPSMAPLDTKPGGATLMRLVAKHEPHLIVIDTLGRALHGGENDADTYRAYYRFTGAPLKAAGLTVLRTDHEGQDPKKGQRGSTGKDEDVDLVWRLSVTSSKVNLRATRSRMSWVPREVTLDRQTEPRLAHLLAPTALPKGTDDAVTLLDQLGVPLDASTRAATRVLHDAGEGRRREVVVAAIRLRKERG
jgi:RecA-family ATPase